MTPYTLYIQMPTETCSGDVTLLGFNGKYRSFFWHPNKGAWRAMSYAAKYTMLQDWIDASEKDIFGNTSDMVKHDDWKEITEAVLQEYYGPVEYETGIKCAN